MRIFHAFPAAWNAGAVSLMSLRISVVQSINGSTESSMALVF